MDREKIDILCIDGIEVPCCFQFPETRLYFQDNLLEKNKSPKIYIRVGPNDWKAFHRQFPQTKADASVEIKILVGLVSDWLTDHDRLLMHGVAFIYRERAWILAAESGTGKTTQYINLKKLLGDEIQIICGDNPVLHFLENGKIQVCPSPWNGKEGYGSNRKAVLGGIILLKQGDRNEFTDMTPTETVIPLFHQIMTYMKTESIIHKQISYERKIIDTVPVIQYTNTGTPGSSALLLQQVERLLNI